MGDTSDKAGKKGKPKLSDVADMTQLLILDGLKVWDPGWWSLIHFQKTIRMVALTGGDTRD